MHYNYKIWKILKKLLKYLLINFENSILTNYQILNHLMNKIKNLTQPILVTGAAGFIGANLVRFLVSKGLKVNIIIRKNSNIWRIKDIIRKTNVFYADLRDRKKLRKIVKKIKPKSIFHFATYGAYSSQNDLKLIKSTILNGTINLLNECKKYKFNIFINSGSSSEYGFKKNKMSENSLLEPNSYYAVFKSATTLFCQYEAITNKLPIVTVRFFHVYGQFEEPSRLIPTLIKNLLNNKSSKLVSSNIARDLIFIDDVINLYLLIASKPRIKGDIFNIGSGKQRDIAEIYSKLCNITNVKIKPVWNTMKNRFWDQTNWTADMKFVKKIFRWKPKNNLIMGLTKTVDWYHSYYMKNFKL